MGTPVVHFTHHLCREHSCASERESYKAMTLELDDYRLLYPSVRPPETGACNRLMGAKRPRFTTSSAAVTCSACRTHMDRESRAKWDAGRAKNPGGSYENYADDRELVRRAWLMCCHKHRVPGPCSDVHAVDHERALRAMRIVSACSWALPNVGWSVNPYKPLGERLGSVTEVLEARMAELDPGDRALLAGVLDEARVADSLLAETRKQLDVLSQRALEVAKHVRATALVALPEVN